METKITKDGSKLLIHISGSLNTQTAPDLENSLSRYDKDSITNYVFDFSELDYISSSGLRILLNLTKKVMGKGKVVI